MESKISRLLALMVLLVLSPVRAGAADFDSFAFVNDDGTLQIGHALIHLYGIYIPPTDTTCYTFERPVPCGPRAILALKFDIGTDFVRCTSEGKNPDGSYVATCSTDQYPDLSSTLLQQGWALALPDAPYEYNALEKIARNRGIGVWGIPVERAPPPHSGRRFPDLQEFEFRDRSADPSAVIPVNDEGATTRRRHTRVATRPACRGRSGRCRPD